MPRGVVVERIVDVVNSIKSCKNNATPDSYFVRDLGMDSLQRKQLVQMLSDEFCVRVENEVADKFVSVETAATFFSSHPKAR